MIRVMRGINKYLAFFLVAILLVGYARANVVDVVKTTSGSMGPTVEKDEYVLINKKSEIDRFDVVMFQSPDKRYQNFLKRVVGLPGDTVYYEGGYLYLNGRRIVEGFLGSPTVNPDNGKPYTNDFSVDTIHGSMMIPDGMYFVMGDSRRGSRDSRIIGLVPHSHINGKAVAVKTKEQAWHDWEILEDYDIYGSNVRTLKEYEEYKNRLKPTTTTDDEGSGVDEVKGNTTNQTNQPNQPN